MQANSPSSTDTTVRRLADKSGVGRNTALPSLPQYLAEGFPKQDVEALSDAREFVDELVEWKQRPVEDDDLLTDAARRADANERKTVQSRDL